MEDVQKLLTALLRLRDKKDSSPTALTQAKRWYDQAVQKGQPQAKAALDKLKEYARGLEAKGGADARSLLQNWQ